MKSASCYKSMRGFTLVEVLIALTLSAILATLLFSALHAYSKTSSVGHRYVAARQEKIAVFEFIDRQLRELAPLVVKSSRATQVLFSGNDHKIVYIGRIPSHRSRGGLHRNVLEISGSAPHQNLTFNYSRLNFDDEFSMEGFIEQPSMAPRVLLKGLSEIAFDYFGPEESGEAPQWMSEWLRADELPRVIRIRLRVDGSIKEHSLTIPVLANNVANSRALTVKTRRTGLSRRLGRGRSSIQNDDLELSNEDVRR